jgi:hypothetical protein
MNATQETRMINKWIYENPYPSPETIILRVQEIGNKKQDHQARYEMLENLVEYGPYHEYMKHIYESKIDDTITREIGKIIHSQGGTGALQAACYCFNKFGPFYEANNNIIKFAGWKIEYLWDGIGEFRR